MTRYAVGDIQGCLPALKCLMQKVNFDPQQDQLWIVGDLINRGPESLQTLRFIKQLGSCTRIVLGNHDLHFLAVAYGAVKASKSDTLDELLAADDCEQLCQWLIQQPLIYNDPSNDYHMVHAGIPPIWSLQQTKTYAAEVERVLNSNEATAFFKNMYGDKPARWKESLTGMKRLRIITNYLTRMRFCTARGKLDLASKLAVIGPGTKTSTGKPAANKYAPWFSYPQRLTRDDKIIFGHWAALEGKANTENVFALDTGCVWGGSLTFMNLETTELSHCKCPVK
ncbi:MAG: symmetrical bis(5'-nucleosyl)-tetraphosphatase [Spongiibacteraceae bacterium]